MTDQRTKRPKIKRLDLPCHLFFHGVDLPKYDAYMDANMQVLTDVPVFASDGWFLLFDGTNVRSWFQIKGKPCIARPGCDRAIELSQEDMIRRFKSELYDETKWETELGREATDLLVRSLRTVRKVPDAVYAFVHEQRSLQYMRSESRNTMRGRKAWKESKK